MITTAGLEALERILAEQPNTFHATARETLLALLELGRGWMPDPAASLSADQAARLLEDVPAGRGVRLEAPGLAADAEQPGCPRCHGSGTRLEATDEPGLERVVRCECQAAADPVKSRRPELEVARLVVAERNPDLDVEIVGDGLVARPKKLRPCACLSATDPVEQRPGEDPRVFEVRQRNPGCTVELMGDKVVRTCSAYTTRRPE